MRRADVLVFEDPLPRARGDQPSTHLRPKNLDPRARGDRPVRTAVDPNPAPPTRGSCLVVLSRVAGERSSLVGSLGRRRAGLGLKATGVIAEAAG